MPSSSSGLGFATQARMLGGTLYGSTLLLRSLFDQKLRKFALESASARIAGLEEHLRVFSTVRRQ
ncbi:MAG: hypothetical protein ACK56F_08775, partial [bacterium]